MPPPGIRSSERRPASLTAQAAIESGFLSLLACPACGGAVDGGEVLTCWKCGSIYPVVRGVPRFVSSGDYAESFGYQWRRFSSTQIDTTSGLPLSTERFFSETGWTPAWLRDKTVLDVGCGAGRFAEVASRYAKRVVAMDYSSAVEAASENLRDRENVLVVQGDIFRPPLANDGFDACYCIGVLQHTPEPLVATGQLPIALKEGGRLALTAYERRRFTMLHSKYLARRLTSRVSPGRLLTLIRVSMPALFLASEILFRLPILGRLFRHLIPVANYVDESRLGLRQRYRWAVLDTFDMLSPRFDQPQTEHAQRTALEVAGMTGIRRMPSPGLNLIATKAPT